MQLPRGTFHSMKKGREMGTILEDLREERFSGICALLCGNQSFDLVFQDGLIMLASGDSTCGDATMEIIGTQRSMIADASLSSLTPAQLKLTLEFNAGCRVQRPIPAAQITPASTPGDRLSRRPAEAPRIVPKPGAGKDVRERADDSRVSPPEPVTARSSPAPAREKEAGPRDIFASDSDESTMVDRDLQALDAMDLDTMSQKIRMNCRQMIEKLHLEHLIDDRGG